MLLLNIQIKYKMHSNGISDQHCFLQFRNFCEQLSRKFALIRHFSRSETTNNMVIKQWKSRVIRTQDICQLLVVWP